MNRLSSPLPAMGLNRGAVLILASCLFGSSTAPCAETFSISAASFGSSVATSSGGTFVLTAAIGRPDAALLQGGPYQLAGGFFEEFLEVALPGTAALTLARSGQNVIISWPSAAAGFVLESADSLSAQPISWSTVPGPPVINGEQQSVTVTLPKQSRFYRLRGP